MNETERQYYFMEKASGHVAKLGEKLGRKPTCCADDTSFIGYVCKCASAKSLVMGSWVDVTATVKWGYMKVYDGEGPVLYAKEIKPAKKPESELVYFN